MKVFVSYGQDRNAPLVERIGGDLRAAGHEIWIDKSKIKAGDDWRRSILDGLVDTDWTLGFLSKHSTRDPGVCLDELAIAMHVKGGTIATVLMESEAEVEPPVSVSRIQWLDLHDWAEREAEGGRVWEDWYHAKLNEILALLAHPDTQRFAGEIKDLERCLKPVTQEVDIGVLVEGFVGRAWLHDKLEDWRRNAKGSRLFWLSGPAGTGKSAFAAWLAHRGRANVIGLNLCRYNLDDRRDAGRVIRTLAFQIATRLPDYRRLVLERLSNQDVDGSELARKGPAALFDWLLIEPLRHVIDGGRSDHRYLVVIDGLDETVRDGRSELAEVLREHAKKLPAWMAMVVTSRPDEPILRQFAGLQPVSIKADSNENLDDLRVYARDWLTNLDLPEGEMAAFVDRAVAASEGNFLYLRMLREAGTAGTLSLFAPEGLPQGLVGLFERWFRRQFPDAKTYEIYVPLLAVLAAAEHPVPEPWLARMFRWSKRDAARMLEGLGSLFERRPDGVAPFHKSLRDWLVDAKASGAEFVVDETEGAKRLVDALWAEFAQWAGQAGPGELDAFCTAELPAQMARLRAEDVRMHLSAKDGWSAVGRGLFEVAGSLARRYLWEGALAWWGMTQRLAEMSGEPGRSDQAHAFTEAGDILATVGRSAAALKSFRDGLAIRERLATSDPGNASWQRDLSVSHDKTGDVLVAQGNLPEALKSFRDGLAIAERLARSDPANASWQRNLSVFHDRVGDVQVAQGNLPEAQASYRQGLAIADRLAKSDPGNAGWQRDLSVFHDRVGDVLVSQGNLPEAEMCFRAGLAIADRLAKSDPGNALWQRDLSVSCDKIGDVLAALGDLPEALKSFRDGLAIKGRLAKSDPGNAGWQSNLAASCNRIGDALVAQGDLPEAQKSFRDGLAIAERLAKSDPGNASWQRDLSVFHDRVGEVLVALGDLPEALTSFRDGLAIAEQLASSDPGNASWQRDLSVFHDRVGDVLMAQGDVAEALKTFREGLAIAERLAKSDPGNAIWQRDLSVSCDKIADILVVLGDLPEALKSFREGLAIAERLAKSGPGNALWQRDLSVSYNRIGDALVAQGNLPEALESFREGLAIRERLANSDPGNALWRSDLSASHDRVGDVLVALGNLPQALKSFRDGLAIADRLANSDPGDARWRRFLPVSYDKIGDLLVAQGNLPEALKSFRDGLAIRNRLANSDPGNAAWLSDLSLSCDKIGEVLVAQGQLLEALKSFRDGLAIRDRLAKSDPGNAGWQRDLSASYSRLGTVLASAGEIAQAVDALRQGRAIITHMVEASPDNTIWKRKLAWFDEQIAEPER